METLHLNIDVALYRLKLNFERVALLQLQGVSVCAVHVFDVQLIRILILYTAAVKGGVRCAPGKGQKGAYDKDDTEKFLLFHVDFLP